LVLFIFFGLVKKQMDPNSYKAEQENNTSSKTSTTTISSIAIKAGETTRLVLAVLQSIFIVIFIAKLQRCNELFLHKFMNKVKSAQK
ncbi:hypothetical protein T09_10859, partial [Trichinella sp. T9]